MDKDLRRTGSHGESSLVDILTNNFIKIYIYYCASLSDLIQIHIVRDPDFASISRKFLSPLQLIMGVFA